MGSPKTRMQRQHATLRPFAARSHAGANDLSATDEEEEEASDEEEDTSEEEEEADRKREEEEQRRHQEFLAKRGVFS